jgi:heme-degrading monooxygenase HmoA
MIVVVSRITVVSGNADALAERYRTRMGLAESVEGCLGVEILRSLDDPDAFEVYTRWINEASYAAYRKHPAFRTAHEHIRDIPGGLKIDASTRSVRRYEVLS